MRIRIYYNRMADLPRIWSFDHGTQETEQQITGWKLYDVDAASGQDLDIPANDKERPRVWIELSNMLGCTVNDGVLYVYGRI